MPGPHDLGGKPAGPIDRTDHRHGDFERHMDAVLSLLGDRGQRVIRVDELRRAIESLPDYGDLAYYEKWAKAVKLLLIEKGLITEEELAKRISDLTPRARSEKS